MKKRITPNDKKIRGQPRLIGRYVVTDPAICHGKPTFRGTRVLVSHVLEQVAEGMSWDAIVSEWRGSINKEAIAEAVRLANRAFLDHANEYTAPEYVLERVAA
jgi:uncharacterized protein (DUF433 family)